MLYLGIDPGKGGGLAVLTAEGRPVEVVRMPETERDLLDLLLRHTREDLVLAVLEKVNAGVWGYGKTDMRMGVTSAFSFGCGYGRLRMALIAASIPFDEVMPRRWQQAMNCLTHGDKHVSKRRAQELFPHVKVTNALADALIIAEYCRRLHSGILHG